MAPRAKKGKTHATAEPSPGPEPALERSTVINQEGLGKVRQALAADTNEWKATKVWPASRFTADLGATEIPLHLHALFAGLLPPFSDFFNAVLSHYQIHALHLDPGSIILLSGFAFLCEAFAGIAPSVALLRHFFSLHLVDGRQRSGCVSLQAVAATADSGIDFTLHPDARGFRKQWVYVDATAFSPLLLLPRAPAEASSGWGHAELADSRAARVLGRLAKLRQEGVTMAMVVKEFVRRRIAPLQRHSRPMWAFTGPSDPMRLQVPSLPSKTLQGVLQLLTGGDPALLPPEGRPLYAYPNAKAFAEKMPRFDEWGLPPEGHEGPRDNPLLVTPTLGDPSVRAPEAAAGEQAPPCAPEVAAGGRSPPRAPEIAAGGQAPPRAPEVAAEEREPPRAPEVAAEEREPPRAPEVAAEERPVAGAAVASATRSHALAPSGSLLGLAALRKRKGFEGRRGPVLRALKKVKWVAVDE
jgi:hypothetical protein